MIRGFKGEEKGFEWFKANYDSNATWLGGSDSTSPDIISPKMGIIEVKSFPAQSGQFTDKTANNYKYSQDIINLIKEAGKENNQQIVHESCKNWVKDYYVNHKQVNYFLVIDNKEIFLLTPEQYFESYNFACVYRFKKSGSRNATKKLAKKLPKNISAEWRGKKLYTADSSLYDWYFSTSENDCYINDEGEIRILSKTKNATYIFKVIKND